MKLVIAVPSPGEVRAETLTSVLTLGIALERGDIPFRLAQFQSSDIVESRNRLSANFLSDPEATHLLFVDADMGFPMTAVQRLIDFDVPLVGAIYPKRGIDLDRLVEASRVHPKLPAEALVAGVLEHVYFSGPWEGEPQPRGVRDGFFRVSGIGMGLTLIARSTFQTMIEHDVATELVTDGEHPLHDFFGVLHSNDDRQRYSEDLSFCRRWVLGCGGEVWGDGKSPVVHVGSAAHCGTLMQGLSLRD